MSLPNPTPAQGPVAAPPSMFVTVTAWIFIVITGLGVLALLLQNLLLATLMASPEVQHALNDLPTHTDGATTFIVRHMRAIAAAMLALVGIALVSAIGLLQRRNWARLCFVGVLVVAVLYQLGRLAYVWLMPLPMPQSPDGSVNLASMMDTLRVASTVMAMALTLVASWLVIKLCSPAIRAEFQSAAALRTLAS